MRGDGQLSPPSTASAFRRAVAALPTLRARARAMAVPALAAWALRPPGGGAVAFSEALVEVFAAEPDRGGSTHENFVSSPCSRSRFCPGDVVQLSPYLVESAPDFAPSFAPRISPLRASQVSGRFREKAPPNGSDPAQRAGGPRTPGGPSRWPSLGVWRPDLRRPWISPYSAPTS